MAIISPETEREIILSKVFTVEKMNSRGTWVQVHRSSYTYAIAMGLVIKERAKDQFAHLRIETMAKTSEGIHVHYDAYS